MRGSNVVATSDWETTSPLPGSGCGLEGWGSAQVVVSCHATRQSSCRNKCHLLMAPYRRKRSVNAAELLNRRSRGIRDAGALIRHNMKVLRGVILQVMRLHIHCSKLASMSVCFTDELSSLLLLCYRTAGISIKCGARPQSPQ